MKTNEIKKYLCLMDFTQEPLSNLYYKYFNDKKIIVSLKFKEIDYGGTIETKIGSQQIVEVKDFVILECINKLLSTNKKSIKLKDKLIFINNIVINCEEYNLEFDNYNKQNCNVLYSSKLDKNKIVRKSLNL